MTVIVLASVATSPASTPETYCSAARRRVRNALTPATNAIFPVRRPECACRVQRLPPRPLCEAPRSLAAESRRPRPRGYPDGPISSIPESLPAPASCARLPAWKRPARERRFPPPSAPPLRASGTTAPDPRRTLDRRTPSQLLWHRGRAHLGPSWPPECAVVALPILQNRLSVSASPRSHPLVCSPQSTHRKSCAELPGTAQRLFPERSIFPPTSLSCAPRSPPGRASSLLRSPRSVSARSAPLPLPCYSDARESPPTAPVVSRAPQHYPPPARQFLVRSTPHIYSHQQSSLGRNRFVPGASPRPLRSSSLAVPFQSRASCRRAFPLLRSTSTPSAPLDPSAIPRSNCRPKDPPRGRCPFRPAAESAYCVQCALKNPSAMPAPHPARWCAGIACRPLPRPWPQWSSGSRC